MGAVGQEVGGCGTGDYAVALKRVALECRVSFSMLLLSADYAVPCQNQAYHVENSYKFLKHSNR